MNRKSVDLYENFYANLSVVKHAGYTVIPCESQVHCSHIHVLCTVIPCESQVVTYMCYELLGRVLCLSWHQSNNSLVTGASDSTVRVYNITSGKKTLAIL